MTDQQPVHRLFLHLQELPLSLRTLYTAVLIVFAFGYSFAMIYVWVTHANLDGKPMLTVQDLIIAYRGNNASSKLEAALKGPMARMAPDNEKAALVAWVHAGHDKAGYEARIRPIVEKRCLACHDGSNPHIPNLKGYDNISKVTEVDTGANLSTLVRVSHIHLFGITFIFFMMGVIFSHAYVRPVWFKCVVIVLPFLSVMLDVASWYLTKWDAPFAWAVLISGGMMGFAFSIEWLVSMYQLWFYKLPERLTSRVVAGASFD